MSGNDQMPIKKEDVAMSDIRDPNDTDVLCGRGGAALRHPGNQTYRRLVNLNKGLYITCLKTEKLKISRSIVAAIREQNGRFLEKDAAKGSWFDIGDKKAIEKTSQALREGQPKLRQKIVEMGGGAAGTAALIEQQFGANGIYPSAEMNIAAAVAANANGANMGMDPSMAARMGQSGIPMISPQQQLVAAQAAAAGSARNLQQQQQQNMDMPPPPPQPPHMNSMNTNNDMMNQQFGMGGEMDMDAMQRQMALRPSLVKRGPAAAHELGMNSNLSVMSSDFSAFNGQSANFMDSQFSLAGSKKNMNSMGLSHSQHQQMQGMGGANASNHSATSPAEAKSNFFDRRRIFAASKYRRPASGRFQSNHSLGDGMPDIHMVESSMSVYSNLSSVTGTSEKVGVSGLPSDLSAGLSGGSAHGYGLGGSRHSIMSGLSRISDNSEVNSIFSDLSRKIGNVSTRSIAMSEISGIDEQEREDDDSHTFGTLSTAEPRSQTAGGSGSGSGGGMDLDWL